MLSSKKTRCAFPLCRSDNGVKLKKCTRCLCVFYCSVSHQRDDFFVHGKRCKAVAAGREALDREEAALRSLPIDNLFNPQPFAFTEGFGFKALDWGDWETRNYGRARLKLILKLSELSMTLAPEVNRLCHEQILLHQSELLRLFKSDNLGVRYLKCTTLLWLGRFGECMTFIRYWRLNEKVKMGKIVASVISPIRDFWGVDESFIDILDFVLAVAFIKICVLINARAMLAFNAFLDGLYVFGAMNGRANTPMRVLNGIYPGIVLIRDFLGANATCITRETLFLLAGSAVGRQAYMTSCDILAEHVSEVVGVAKRANAHLASCMSPRNGKHIVENVPSTAYCKGSMEEAIDTVKNVFPLWRQHPQALDMLLSAFTGITGLVQAFDGAAAATAAATVRK